MTHHSITAQYQLHTQWLVKELSTVTDEESSIRISPVVNPIKWIAGHVTDTRMTLLTLLTGSGSKPEYKSLFGKGSYFNSSLVYPTLDAMQSEWDQTSALLIAELQQMKDSALIAPPPFQTSIPDQTLLGLIAYFASHESYHIGQISILRKLLEAKSDNG